VSAGNAIQSGEEFAALRAELARLEQQNFDLELELQAAIEHGDAIEAELALANDQMRCEIGERIRAEAKLQRLLSALKEQKDDLELLVHTITEHSDEIDVERELANEQLRLENERIRLAKEHAEALARIKAEFVAVVSHEVRTPMNGLLGMARLLLDTELTHEQRDMAETVVSSGKLLLNILDDILDLSKLEASRLQLENIEFNLVQLVEESLGLMSMRASERGLAVAQVIDPAIPALAMGDPMRLRQVLTNLINNATKFTEKGAIVVRVSLRGGLERIRFAITDTGIGISADAQDRLFHRYVQADTWVSRKFGGTGLGLAICKQLVELMGGEIGVDSTPGDGSTFWFEVPLGQAAGERPRVRPQLTPSRVLLVEPEALIRDAAATRLAGWGIPAECVGPAGVDAVARPGDVLLVGARVPRADALDLSSRHGLPAIISSPAGTLPPHSDGHVTVTVPEPVTEAALAHALDWIGTPVGERPRATPQPVRSVPAEQPPLRSLKMLVVEDNPVNQRVAVGMLTRKGHVVVTADNGADAMKRLQAEKFDLVLMDRHMPVMDGLEAVRALRALPPPLGALPVVALTAAATQDEIRECLAAGMNDFVPKPFSPEQLAEVIERVMGEGGGGGEVSPEVVGSLREMLGDHGVDELVGEYLRTAEGLLADIRQATTMRDGKALAYAAHSLKSSSSMIGLVAMSDACAAIEGAIREGRLEDALARTEGLAQCFTRAQARLTEL
jgi:signal transduction histidine kinase/CheY-like chemotaxis protein/HPt (histidine-containing phosphotransfer) domain-containing protein